MQRIKTKREELQLSYQQLADITGMSKSTLQRYETGGIKNIPLDKLEILATALKTTPEWILGLAEKFDVSLDYSFGRSEEKTIINHIAHVSQESREQHGRRYQNIAAGRVKTL